MRSEMPDKINTVTKTNVKEELEKRKAKMLVSFSDSDENEKVRENENVRPAPKKTGRKTAVGTEKIKVNLYMDAEVKRAVEEAQPQLRRMARKDAATKINYSLIIQKFVEVGLEEMERYGASSKAVKAVIEAAENET